MLTRDIIFQVLLWLSAIGLTIWAGGTLYQMVVIVPMWSHSPPETVTSFFEGTRYNETIWNFFGPPFMAARILPLIGALFVGWHLRAHRPWLLVAVTGMLIAVILTLLYIYPINAVLFENAGRGLTSDEVRDLVRKWIIADRVRFVIGCVAVLGVLRALNLPIRRD